MSAWIVTDDHIRLIAQAQALYGDETLDLDKLCTDLYRENVKSVNFATTDTTAPTLSSTTRYSAARTLSASRPPR